MREIEKKLGNKNIGKTLKAIRNELEYTQVKVQKMLTYPCNLSKLETGVTHVSLSTLYDLLNIYHVTFDEFIFALNGFTHHYEDHISTLLTNRYSSLSSKQLIMLINQLENSTSSVFGVEKTQLITWRLKCFYYMNLEQDFEKGQKYARLIYDFLTKETSVFSIFHIELAIMSFCSLSYDEAHFLFKQTNEALLKWESLNYSTDLKIRLHLARAKNMFHSKLYQQLSSECLYLHQLAIENGRPDFISDTLILRGLCYINTDILTPTQLEEGTEFIKSGLDIAKQNHLTSLYLCWHRYLSDRGYI